MADALVIATNADEIMLADSRAEVLKQLRALTAVMSGDEFSDFSDEIQKDYCWAVHRLASEAAALDAAEIKMRAERRTS